MNDRRAILIVGLAWFCILLVFLVGIILVGVWAKWDKRCSEIGGDAVSRGVCYVKSTGEIKGFVAK